MRFKGKIAVWYWILLIIANGMCLFNFDYFQGRTAEIAIYVIIADFVLLPPVFRNYVILKKDTLTICFGFGKDEIKIKDIIEIREKHSPAGATSFDRLVIKTKEKDFSCSVKEKEEFLREVKNIRRKIIITRKAKKDNHNKIKLSGYLPGFGIKDNRKENKK